MLRMFLAAALVGGMLAVPGPAGRARAADVPKPIPGKIEIDSKLVEMLAVLHGTEFHYDKDLQTTPLMEVLGDLSKKYGIRFAFDNTAFENHPQGLMEAKAEKLIAIKLDGMTVGRFLTIYLRGLRFENVTYLVRDDHVEITSMEAVQQETGLMQAFEKGLATEGNADTVRARFRSNPLVSLAVEDKPLSAVLGDLSKTYGLNVVVETSARSHLGTKLTERLLNVPADTALELLVGQAGLSVKRKDNTFRVTVGE